MSYEFDWRQSKLYAREWLLQKCVVAEQEFNFEWVVELLAEFGRLREAEGKRTAASQP